MTTSQLFYDEPDLHDTGATILRAMPSGQDELEVVLDRTPFYPEGGGQPCDLGTIGGFPVLSVSWVKGEIVHIVRTGTESGKAASILASGASVRCIVDYDRRRDHSEQHTAQHLLSATVLRLLGAPTKSFHLGERYSSVDVDIPVMDRADADTVEAAVLEVVMENYHIITHLCPPEDPESFPLRRKPPAGEDILRILEIDGIDYTPCAGTHLRNTGDINSFRILKTEKYKGMTRIYFLAGGRAIADHVKLAALVRDTAAAAGCAEDDVAAFMAGAMEKTARLEGELKATLDKLAVLEVKAVLDALPGLARQAGRIGQADTAIQSGMAGMAGMAGMDVLELGQGSGAFAGFILLLCSDRDYAGVSRLAKAGAATGRNTIAVSFVDNKIAAATVDNGPDTGRLLKPLMQSHGGKGGGSSFFQAAFPGASELKAFIEDLRGSTL
jgi:alanyl-tRNA synthetase